MSRTHHHGSYIDREVANMRANAACLKSDDELTAGVYDFTEDEPDCPLCGGRGTFLGSLGRTEHFRCRDCGWDFSEQEAATAAAQDDDARAL
jgi:tRNA(Ile2) C34 agmatinyltransferase TiaS